MQPAIQGCSDRINDDRNIGRVFRVGRCMSTAWVMGFFVGHNWMVTRFSEEAQDDVYGGSRYPKIPGQIRPMHKARSVAGGYEPGATA